MQKITPFLLLNSHLEEAINFYTSTFKNAKVTNVRNLGPTVKTATFEIEGQEFMALEGGPKVDFSMAISFFINCDTQEEVDHLWDTLSAGGEKSMCGWLQDKYGLWWQVVPADMMSFINGPDPVKAGRAMQAMMKMSKLDLQVIQDAYNGK